jgi:DNA-binding NarL/FixJ family response regulator
VNDKRILIVEDEAIIAMGIRNSLRRLGYTVIAMVSSGEAALRKAVETSPDLVLMDIYLSGELNGIQTARYLRRHFDIPVIYLTAYQDEATYQQAQLTNPAGFLLKPFDERILDVTIQQALREKGNCLSN